MRLLKIALFAATNYLMETRSSSTRCPGTTGASYIEMRGINYEVLL
jgi:hypothetical protein